MRTKKNHRETEKDRGKERERERDKGKKDLLPFHLLLRITPYQKGGTISV